jgi:hypothetical protein
MGSELCGRHISQRNTASDMQTVQPMINQDFYEQQKTHFAKSTSQGS